MSILSLNHNGSINILARIPFRFFFNFHHHLLKKNHRVTFQRYDERRRMNFDAVEYHRKNTWSRVFVYTVHRFTFGCFSCIPRQFLLERWRLQSAYVAQLNSCKRRWGNAECGLSTKFRVKKQVAQRWRSRSKRWTITGRENRFWISLIVLFWSVLRTEFLPLSRSLVLLSVFSLCHDLRSRSVSV